MLILAALLLNLGGLAFIALSMRKHYRQVFFAEPSTVGARLRRTAGWLLLGSSLVPFLIGEGPSVGVVMWTGVLTVNAVSVTMLLTYRPRAVVAVAFAAPLFAVVLSGIDSRTRHALQRGNAARVIESGVRSDDSPSPLDIVVGHSFTTTAQMVDRTLPQ